MPKKLIKNCDTLSFAKSEAEVVANQDILISGNTIEAVGNTNELQFPPETEIIDAAGLMAVPGFMNTHAHTPMVLFRNLAEDVSQKEWFNDYIWPMESNLTEEDVYWGMLLGMAEMIENGVTSVADHYFNVDHIARAVESAGMRANLSGRYSATRVKRNWTRLLILLTAGKAGQMGVLPPGWGRTHRIPPARNS